MFNFKINNQEFEFETAEDVFYPTGTTKLLISSTYKLINKPMKILDLGCGIGVIGIVLSKLGCVKGPIYGSDLSNTAINLARKNAEKNDIRRHFVTSSLFDLWKDEKFDLIIEDVPGISSYMRKYSDWFPSGVPFAAGEDGTELVCEVIKQAPLYLNSKGILIFPVLSLSNISKILDQARLSFNSVECIGKKLWGLTEEMKLHEEELWKLHDENKIVLIKKFGMTLWYTEIYRGI